MGTTADSIQRFIRVFYELDTLNDGDATYGFLRTNNQITTLTVAGVANDPATVDEGTPISTLVRNPAHKRRYGITARYIVLTRLIGDTPVQARVYRTIPILTKVIFQACVLNAAYTYQSQDDWALAYRQDEYHSWQINF